MSLSPSINYQPGQQLSNYSSLTSFQQSEPTAKEVDVPTPGNISPSPNPADIGGATTTTTTTNANPTPSFDNTMLASATAVTSTAGPTSGPTATSTTTPTDSATAHMSSYGGALTSPAYGASSLGAYSAYPYGSLGATGTGTADVWGAAGAAGAAGAYGAGAYSSAYAGGDYAGTTPFTGTYPPYYSEMNDGVRRKNATRESTNTLKAWLNEHKKNPYPTKGEKIMLAIITKMTLTQVSTWFANARRRLKKENKMTWVPKNRPENDDDENSCKDDDDKDDTNDQNQVGGVQFGVEQDERLGGSKMSPGLAGKPGVGGLDGNFNGQSYNSPVASLQTWVNGFAPPTSVGDVKTETANGATDPNSTPPGGVEAVYKTDTSSNVSPLSSTLSANVPYSSHPYAATTTTSASSYDQSAAAAAASAYYAAGGAYYHPATLSSMDPYGYSSTAQSTTSTQPFAQAKF